MLDLIEVGIDGIVVADDLLCQQYITFYESINTICDHFYRGAGHFAHEFAVLRAAAGQERDDLGDVLGLVADALHIRDHLQRRRDLPQVARDRLLLEQQLEAEGFDIPLLLVDLRVQRRDLLREAHVSVRHRLGGQCDHLFAPRAHFDQLSVQQRKLLVKPASHHPNLPVI